VAEQPADAVCVAVALASRVDNQRPLPGAAEHQRSAQPAAPAPTTMQSHSFSMP
jgi:hypothetical protein